ncbi:MAG: hypothetical protein ACRCTP_03740 [Aeromonas popoffii]|uniref:hypothetical protein n=1 Tax=Aeromonas popoffii TaxID=70856 RepID=UPI003F36E601
MKIIITGVNCNNDHLLNRIAGDAGFLGLVHNSMDTTATLDIGSIDSCTDAGISLQVIQQMVGRYVMCGFGVSVEHGI